MSPALERPEPISTITLHRNNQKQTAIAIQKHDRDSAARSGSSRTIAIHQNDQDSAERSGFSIERSKLRWSALTDPVRDCLLHLCVNWCLVGALRNLERVVAAVDDVQGG